MTLGWGLVGIGKLADSAIAPAIAKQKHSRIAAVCSRDLSRAKGFAERHGAGEAYDDYEQMLLDPAVDIVYIATPNSLHSDQTVKAFTAGKHVLVEKPLALSLADGRAMLEAAATSGRKLGVGFHLRHKASNIAARDAIRAGRLGRIFLAEISIGAGKGYYPYDTWRVDPQLAGGGTLLNQGVHILDLLTFLTDRRINDVTCFTDDDQGEDAAAAVCVLEGGILATVSSHQLYMGTRPEWVVFGEDGWLHGRRTTTPLVDDEVVLHTSQGETTIGSATVPAYDAEVEAFAEAVQNDIPVNGTGDEGLHNIAVFEALYRSASKKQAMPVEPLR